MIKGNLIDELIMGYMEGSCSSEDAEFLHAWIAESEENRCHFESLKSVWKLTSFDMSEDIDVECALRDVNSIIDGIEAEKHKIYPNPTDGEIVISGERISQIAVFDAFGRKVCCFSAKDDEVRLDLSDYSDGLYLLRVISENGAETHRVMLAH